MTTVPLHYRIADKVMELVKHGSHRRTVQERLNNGTIEQVSIDTTAFQINGEIFISSADIYDGLKASAIKLVIRIQKELKMNNPLWECVDKEKSEVRSGLAQLKKKGIIEPIPGTDMFIVNPAMIRKGKPLSVYGALYEYCKLKYEKDNNWRPTNADIKKFATTKNVLLPVRFD